KLLEQQIKLLQDSLKAMKEAKDKIEAKRFKEKSRCVSVMVAAVAQDNLAGKEGAQRAAVRDAALQIAALVKKDKLDDALQKAGDLSSVQPNDKTKAVA